MESNSAKWQRDYRERNAKFGRKEIRGIIATDGEEAVIKPVIKKMLAELRKKAEQSI